MFDSLTSNSSVRLKSFNVLLSRTKSNVRFPANVCGTGPTVYRSEGCSSDGGVELKGDRRSPRERGRMGTSARRGRTRRVPRVRELLLELPRDLDASDAAHPHLADRLLERGYRLPRAELEDERRVRLPRGLDLLRLVPLRVPDPLDDDDVAVRGARAGAFSELRVSHPGRGLHERLVPRAERGVAVAAVLAVVRAREHSGGGRDREERGERDGGRQRDRASRGDERIRAGIRLGRGRPDARRDRARRRRPRGDAETLRGRRAERGRDGARRQSVHLVIASQGRCDDDRRRGG
eukprot:30895-Pelagococcus_subviridis.AAC.8